MKSTSTKSDNHKTVLVGIISDTHGVLLPAVQAAFKEVDLIIHAGDVGTTEVLDELESIAPVVAVRGNMDGVEGLASLPETEAVEAGDALLYVIHDIHRLDIVPRKAGVNAVIFGHLHSPSIDEDRGVLFLNPGSAAQPRRNFPASVALLRIRGNTITPQIINIDD
jgi:putative phosphoesterase